MRAAVQVSLAGFRECHHARWQIDERQARRLSDMVRSDASVNNAYAPVGYFEGFSIRGFSIDLARSIRIDGLMISGEQNVWRTRTRSVRKS